MLVKVLVYVGLPRHLRAVFREIVSQISPEDRRVGSVAFGPAGPAEISRPGWALLRCSCASRTVTVETGDTTWRVHHNGELLTEVDRTTTRPIARFKARKPEPPRRRLAPGNSAKEPSSVSAPTQPQRPV